jgi:uncharacterized protein (DUF1800 family)
MSWKRLVATMVRHSRVQVGPARLTERLVFFVTELLVKSAQKALVVYAHCLQEVHFQLLSVTTQLGSQSVTLALKLFF